MKRQKGKDKKKRNQRRNNIIRKEAQNSNYQSQAKGERIWLKRKEGKEEEGEEKKKEKGRRGRI